MDREKVLKLAKLARIELSDDEALNLSHEFDSILNYVGEVKKAGLNISKSAELDKKDFHLRNILREDAEAHDSGLYTEKLLEQAPDRDASFVRVKKIL